MLPMAAHLFRRLLRKKLMLYVVVLVWHDVTLCDAMFCNMYTVWQNVVTRLPFRFPQVSPTQPFDSAGPPVPGSSPEALT